MPCTMDTSPAARAAREAARKQVEEEIEAKRVAATIESFTSRVSFVATPVTDPQGNAAIFQARAAGWTDVCLLDAIYHHGSMAAKFAIAPIHEKAKAGGIKLSH